MLLRLLALLFAAAALVLGLSLGWGLPFAAMLSWVNPRALTVMQDGVRGLLWAGAWDSLFVPVLHIPAWAAPAAISGLLFLTAAMRPGRG